MVTTKQAEFNDLRSQMYEQAIAEYPLARAMDIVAMKEYLSPKDGDKILDLGGGNGYFAQAILESIGLKGRYTVVDPSKAQLSNLSKRVKLNNLETQAVGAESFRVKPESFDKLWSFGAFHQCIDQMSAIKNIYNALKKGGKMVLCDVFQGSDLARHFDGQVARYCNVGHEAKFLSDDFARTLCYHAGFEESKVSIVELPQKWIFDSEHDLGDFIYKLHAMTLFPGTEEEKIANVIKGCRDILGIKYESGKVVLNWPMKCIIAER